MNAARRVNGASVREFRQLVGQTQGDLAKASGLSQTYLSLIESGDRSPTRPDVAKRLADALGVHVTAIYPLESKKSAA